MLGVGDIRVNDASWSTGERRELKTAELLALFSPASFGARAFLTSDSIYRGKVKGLK